jgi:chromosome partitioning protein
MLQKYGVTILPASLDLSGAGNRVGGRAGSGNFIITRSDEYSQEFDYVLWIVPQFGTLDAECPDNGNRGVYSLTNRVPRLQGLSKLLQTVDIVKKRLNPTLAVTGIIGTRYDHRKKLNKEVVEKNPRLLRGYPLPALIRDNIALAEAPSFGQDIFTYRPHSHGAEDYRQLCQEIIERG